MLTRAISFGIAKNIYRQRVGTDVSINERKIKKGLRGIVTPEMITKAYEQGYIRGKNQPHTARYYKDAARTDAYQEGFTLGMKERMAAKEMKTK